MNKRTLLAAAVLAFPVLVYADDSYNSDHVSKTHFTTNPHYSTGRPEHLSLYRSPRMIARKDGFWGSIQVVGFFGESGKEEALARYFMPFRKSCLIIAEGPGSTTQLVGTNTVFRPFLSGTGSAATDHTSDAFRKDAFDLLAHNFNITTSLRTFESKICFCPKQRYVGAALNWRQSLSQNEEKGFWVDITIPVVHVENAMNLTEKVINPGTALLPSNDRPNNMKQALNQKAWKYGRVSPCELKETRIADIEARIGYESVREDRCRYGSFVGVIAPTGNEPTGRFVFEPIVGRAGHWGVIWGGEAGFEVRSNENMSMHVSLDINNNYLFEHNEMRSFDLVDKQWSRYINIFLDAKTTDTTPGINTFTRSLRIRPRGTYQVNSAITCKWKQFDFELGFNYHHRQSEEGYLACPWKIGPAIAGTLGAVGSTDARSMSLANMHMWNVGLIADDPDFDTTLNQNSSANTLKYRPIKESDLNLQSALHPAVIAHTVYASLGVNNEDSNYPTFAGIGGSYQFSADNAGMNRWSVWGKLGVSI